MNPGTAALARGLDVVCALAEPETRDGLGVIALTERVGGDKSQLSRTLRTLEEHGFAERDPETRAYRLGWRLFALAARVAESHLLTAAPPVLRALVRELGESVHLSVRQGDQVLTLLTAVHDAATLVASTAAKLLAYPPAGLDDAQLARLATRGRGLLAHGTGRLAIYTLGQQLDRRPGTSRRAAKRSR